MFLTGEDSWSANCNAKVLVRAIGPSLANAGPTLELHDGNGALIAASDNWKTNQQTRVEATNIPPTNDAESAIVAAKDPSGVGLIEIYNLW